MLRLKKENELWKVSSVLIFFLLLCTFAFAEKVRIHKAGGGGGATDQVGAVTDDKWCVGDGTLVQCTENAPAGAGNVTAEGFVFDQIPYAVSTTGIAGSANILYNNTNPIFKVSNSNLTVLFSRYANQLYINQTNTTGIEWASGSPTSLIWIDDNRAGTTVNEKEEASLVITGDGTYSAYFEDQVYIANQITGTAGLWFKGDDNVGYFGIGVDVDSVMAWDLNGAGDDFFSWGIRRQAASDSATLYLFTDYTNNNPSGDTAHDNYISPTLVMLNSNGADAGDYAAVVMGGRTQSNVAATHYFDFYAMTGASDGGVSAVTTEIPAMFRIGDSGTATSGHSLSSGDVLFEDDVEINGVFYPDGGIDGYFTEAEILALANLTYYFNRTTDIPLGTNTSGNYVASVATTAPLTGGAAGSEGATITIVIPKATTSVDGYLNSTDWTTFNGKMAGDLAKDLVTTAPITGGTDNILPGADADVTLAITMTGDIVATAPILINATTEVNDILPGNDVDTTISINMLGDLATTSPITGAAANIFPGTDGAKATIAFDNGALLLKNQTKSITIYNVTASHDVLLWATPKAITIINITMSCVGGTDVVAVLQECNVTGFACVNSNTTFWQTLAGQGTFVDDFNDAAIDAHDVLAINVTTVNGTPSNYMMSITWDE